MGVRLYAMTCGWLTMPYGFFLAGEEGWLAVPVPSYLIVHPRGTVVFDTGLETALQINDAARRAQLLAPNGDLIRPSFRSGDNVAERLRASGRDPGRIDFIVNSHLHLDHCGGNELIPNARVVVQRREWAAATRADEIAANHYVPRLYDLGHDRIAVDGEHDLFDDGTVVLVPTPGHTPGHQSLRVRVSDGTVLLSADACYLRATLERMVLPDPRVVQCGEAMRASLTLIRRMQADGVVVVFGHDPDQWPRLTDGPLTEIDAGRVTAAARAARAPQAVAA